MRIKKVIKLIKKYQNPTSTDETFEVIRKELCVILKQYDKNQTDPELIDRAWQLIHKLEVINRDDDAGFTYERAITNSVVTSSRIKRTHYAAYMAGKTSMYEDVGDKFKSWMHNAAANGAISLGDLLDDLQFILRKQDDKNEVSEHIKVFRNAAFEDAARILDFSVNFDSSSPLTLYNKAKLDILSKQAELRQSGIEQLLKINPPQNDFHPAELSWHVNNYESFTNADVKMRKIMKVQDGDQYRLVEGALKRNYEIATEIIKSRGNIWQNQTPANRSVVVTMSVGIAIAAIIPFFPPEIGEYLKDILAVGLDQMLSHMDPNFEAQVIQNTSGDGGIAAHVRNEHLSIAATEMFRATFGDGGLA